jgi:hypothetical protein
MVARHADDFRFDTRVAPTMAPTRPIARSLIGKLTDCAKDMVEGVKRNLDGMKIYHYAEMSPTGPANLRPATHPVSLPHLQPIASPTMSFVAQGLIGKLTDCAKGVVEGWAAWQRAPQSKCPSG